VSQSLADHGARNKGIGQQSVVPLALTKFIHVMRWFQSLRKFWDIDVTYLMTS